VLILTTDSDYYRYLKDATTRAPAQSRAARWRPDDRRVRSRPRRRDRGPGRVWPAIAQHAAQVFRRRAW